LNSEALQATGLQGFFFGPQSSGGRSPVVAAVQWWPQSSGGRSPVVAEWKRNRGTTQIGIHRSDRQTEIGCCDGPINPLL
jgi:hypothetical protein